MVPSGASWACSPLEPGTEKDNKTNKSKNKNNNSNNNNNTHNCNNNYKHVVLVLALLLVLVLTPTIVTTTTSTSGASWACSPPQQLPSATYATGVQLGHVVPHWWLAACVEGERMVRLDLCGPAYGIFDYVDTVDSVAGQVSQVPVHVRLTHSASVHP